MVKEASHTASWVNSQPWKVYVATGATLQTIKEDHKRLIAQGVKSSPVFPVLSRTGFQPDQQANMAQWSEEQVAYARLMRRPFGNSTVTCFTRQPLFTLAYQKRHHCGRF